MRDDPNTGSDDTSESATPPEAPIETPAEAPAEPPMSAARRLFWRILGWTLFGIGLVGVMLPLWPTTILWVLAVFALGRADPAMVQRIRAWPKIGPIVADFVDYGVLAPIGKFAAICALLGWAIGLVAFFEPSPPLIALVLALVAVAVYVLTRPSRL